MDFIGFCFGNFFISFFIVRAHLYFLRFFILLFHFFVRCLRFLIILHLFYSSQICFMGFLSASFVFIFHSLSSSSHFSFYSNANVLFLPFILFFTVYFCCLFVQYLNNYGFNQIQCFYKVYRLGISFQTICPLMVSFFLSFASLFTVASSFFSLFLFVFSIQVY